MNEEEQFKILKEKYPSLQYFNYQNGTLSLEQNNQIFSVKLDNFHVFYENNYERINPNLFLLNPIEIFNIIKMIELLHHINLNNSEEDFVKSYITDYLNLTETGLKKECLKRPIDYCDYFPSSPVRAIIKEVKEARNNPRGKTHQGPKLVKILSLKGTHEYIEDENKELPPSNIPTGFATILLIIAIIIITITFITLYILKN